MTKIAKNNESITIIIVIPYEQIIEEEENEERIGKINFEIAEESDINL